MSNVVDYAHEAEAVGSAISRSGHVMQRISH